MKKAVIMAAVLVSGMLMAAPLQVQAKTIVVNQQTGSNSTWLKDCLEKIDWENVKFIKIPCLPGGGTPETPEQPGPEQPSPETPEQPSPEQPSPETPEQPDSETPEQSEHVYVQRVVELVNEERAKAGLSPVTLQKDVTKAAQVRATEIVQSFSHTRPNGSSFSTALQEAGVSYRGSGENIAWGQKTPEQVMEGWMNSAGHRTNILNAKYTSIGVGYYQNASGVNYWTQLFTY